MVRTSSRNRLHTRHPVLLDSRGIDSQNQLGSRGRIIRQPSDREVFVVQSLVVQEYSRSLLNRNKNAVKRNPRFARWIVINRVKHRSWTREALAFLTTGRTQGLLSSSRYAPTPKLTLSLNVSSLYEAVNLKMLQTNA